MPQTTDCHFTESVVYFLFNYVAVNIEQTKKNFWKESLGHNFLQILSCFVLSNTLVIIQSSDTVLCVIHANES